MLRAAVLATVVAALVLGGCGDDASDEPGESRPAATATSAPTGYYEAMDALVADLDMAVAAAISGDAGATKRIKAVIKDVRAELQESGETPAGNLVLTTAASARDYATNNDREGLKLIRRIPIVEARDALRSEAAG